MATVGVDGRYRLLRTLGRGGMGEVHLAVARGAAGFEKLVAIKFLDEKFTTDPELTRSLLREAFLGVHLDHEHIVSVLDLGEDGRRYFIVMEYVRGFTLAHVLSHLDAAGTDMPLAPALHVSRAVLDALAYLHRVRGADGGQLDLVHGDVSPSNVLLAGDGRIKLSDFGVAGFGAEHGDRRMVAGKLSYLPPEAFAGAQRSQAWDTYAAAALVYEVLAGVPAFPAASIEAIRAALRRGAPPLAAHRPDVPPALAAVIDQALLFQPERRIQTIDELRAALESAAPRQIEDGDVHRSLVASVYADPGFVSRHGELPTTAGYSIDLELQAQRIDTTDMAPVTQGRVRSRPLRFGVSPAMGAARARAASERFTIFLSTRLGREVRPVVLADYGMLTACLVEGEIDLAWMPPTTFIGAAEHGAGVLARIQRAGQTSYQSALFARRDGEVRTLADLRGRVVAWVDHDSAGGYLFAAAELRRVLGDLDTGLGDQEFVGSHRAVCEAVIKGWAAAGATYVSRDPSGAVVSAGWFDSLGERAQLVEPLWFSTPIPGDTIAHRPFLPDSMASSIATALIGLGDSPDGKALLSEVFNAEALVAADIRDYDTVRIALGVGGGR